MRRDQVFFNRKGFTLIEIMAVMVIISVLAGVGVRKFDELSDSASAKALEHALSELNSRELLTWALVKFSDQGWVTDEALFAQVDKNMGASYQWASGPATTGGSLQMASASITLTRIPSTVNSAGKWAVN
jgi:prepilin-type N-terminal cleavage/methylation domain-containing protein